MRTPCSHTCLAFILKFLNFLNAFVGVVIIIYSAYVLTQLHHHPPPNHSGFRPNDDALSSNFSSLPAPWFTYAFLATGILIVFISLVGFIGAEAISGCCLCFEIMRSIERKKMRRTSIVAILATIFCYFVGTWKNYGRQSDTEVYEPTQICNKYILDRVIQYAVLTTVFILSEVGLVIFIALDRQWEKDIPSDPTGELDKLWTFINDNADVFMWVGIVILSVQVLSVLLAIVLRSLVSSQNEDDDLEAEYGFRNSSREPLVSPYSGQASGSARGDSDIWSVRMREKYGLNTSSSSDVKPKFGESKSISS